MKTNRYEAYLQSVGWKRRRAAKMRVDGKWIEDANGNRVFVCCDRCESFGRPSAMHVHHRSYENVGNEKFSDLEILCPMCHSCEHSVVLEVVARPTRNVSSKWLEQRKRALSYGS